MFDRTEIIDLLLSRGADSSLQSAEGMENARFSTGNECSACCSLLGSDGKLIRDKDKFKESNKSLNERRITTAGITWICAAQFFAAQVFAQSAWTTSFSWATNYISDLGNTTCGLYPADIGSYVCSPWHTLMNISFVLQGIIILVGAVLARPAFAGLCWRMIVLPLLIVTALGIAGVGLFPEDVNNRAHVISAGIQFITGNIAMIAFGITSLGLKRWRTFAIVSTAFGLTGLLATVLFAQGYGLGLGVGGMERVAAYTLPVWLIIFGVLIIVRKRPVSTPLTSYWTRRRK
ncbi:MAG: DUF998 domain-containing protein [Pyrinomonadaceae bacterium]